MKSKNVFDRGCWSSWSEIQPFLFIGEIPYDFLTFLKHTFGFTCRGFFKNARVCYGRKSIELHVDKHGNLVFRQYENA